MDVQPATRTWPAQVTTTHRVHALMSAHNWWTTHICHQCHHVYMEGNQSVLCTGHFGVITVVRRQSNQSLNSGLLRWIQDHCKFCDIEITYGLYKITELANMASCLEFKAKPLCVVTISNALLFMIKIGRRNSSRWQRKRRRDILGHYYYYMLSSKNWLIVKKNIPKNETNFQKGPCLGQMLQQHLVSICIVQAAVWHKLHFLVLPSSATWTGCSLCVSYCLPCKLIWRLCGVN